MPEPSSAQQVIIRPSSRSLGLDILTLPELKNLARQIPFEPAFVVLSRIAAEMWHIREDGGAQLNLARKLFAGSPLLERYEQFFAANPTAVLFTSQQQFAVAQRLLIEHGRDATLDTDLSDDDVTNAIRLIVHTNDLLDAAARHIEQGVASGVEIMAYIVQSGAYEERPAIVNSFGRAYTLFFELANANPDQRVPLDEWSTCDYEGLQLVEQLAGGFGLTSSTHYQDSDPDRHLVVLGTGVLADTSLADKEASVRAAISAPREWYRERFAQGDGSIRDVVWEVVPFLRRPFLQLSGDRLALVSPRAADYWLGPGFYDRMRESAKKRRKPRVDALNLFTAYYGDLVEDYCLKLVRSVYATAGPSEAARVQGEQNYGRNQRLTPDIAINHFEDIVLIEVRSGVLSPWFRTSGEVREFEKQMKRHVFDKVRQLGQRITDLESGKATIADITFGDVKRIWPVVITANLTMSEPLYDWIESEQTAAMRENPKLQRLLIGDVQDLELLMGLVEQGHDLIEVLAARQETPFVKLDIKRWVLEEMEASNLTRAKFAEDAWERAGEAMTTALWPDRAA